MPLGHTYIRHAYTLKPIASTELAGRMRQPSFLTPARLRVPPDQQYQPRDLNSHPFGLDSESSASTNSTRPAQCQWRESNSHPFGAASQTAAAAVTPHWQERKRRDPNAQDALSNVRRVSSPVQLAISATLPQAKPRQRKPVELPEALRPSPASSGVGLPTCPKAPTEGERVERS